MPRATLSAWLHQQYRQNLRIHQFAFSLYHKDRPSFGIKVLSRQLGPWDLLHRTRLFPRIASDLYACQTPTTRHKSLRYRCPRETCFCTPAILPWWVNPRKWNDSTNSLVSFYLTPLLLDAYRSMCIIWYNNHDNNFYEINSVEYMSLAITLQCAAIDLRRQNLTSILWA